MSKTPKRAPARAKHQRSEPAKSVEEPHGAGFSSPLPPELEQPSMSALSKRSETRAPLHPSALKFLRENDLARTEALARQEAQRKRVAEFLLPQKALNDCAHRVPRLPQPSPDRLSPGADVPAWVRTCIVPAIVAVRQLEATLDHSLRPVFEAPLPAHGFEGRQRPRQLMRELFVDLYEAKCSDSAVQASIATLEALAAADEGEVGVLAEWFEIATYALSEKLVAIATACDETGQTPSAVAANVLRPVQRPRPRKIKRTGRPQVLDVAFAERLRAECDQIGRGNYGQVFAKHGLTVSDGRRTLDTLRKRPPGKSTAKRGV